MPNATVTSLQRYRWLSMQHVGASKPKLRAFVRKGHLQRQYKQVANKDVHCFVPGLKGPNWAWIANWVADTDYMEVPQIVDAKGDQDYSQKGIEQVTLTLDNIGMIQQTGNMGALFHTIQRGYYSPQRGYRPPYGSPAAGAQNEWFDTWKDKATQLIIIAGYGDAVFPLHLGLIDDVKLTSRPDTIVVTLRNMGQFLTDQHVIEDAKPVWIRDPITFADRVFVQEGPNVADTAQAKSSWASHPPKLSVDGSYTSMWMSDQHAGPTELEWIEFPLPAGHYIKFDLYPAFQNLEMFVSFSVTSDNVPGGGPANMNGKSLPNGWISDGTGQVPGTSIPYLQRVAQVNEKFSHYPITTKGLKIVAGDNSKLRLWFRNLAHTANDSGKGQTYRAGVRDCKVYNAHIPKSVAKAHWILVDDIADVVKTVLQWVGITDWDIETTGVRLSDKITFDRTKFLMDIIQWCCEQTGFIFYVKPPADFDLTNLAKSNAANLSMGIAIFRQSSSMKQTPHDSIEAITDRNLLTAVEGAFDANQLPNSVRVRGKAVSDKRALTDPEHIHEMGADRTKRFQYSYRPVWARSGDNAGGAGLRRVEVHYDEMLFSVYDCEVACLIIAYRAALESAKATIEVPLWPLIHLDHQTLLFDTGTGLSTRLWVVQRTWNYSVGDGGRTFKMNLGGSLMDINDISQTREELENVLNEGGYMPAEIARGPWEHVHPVGSGAD